MKNFILTICILFVITPLAAQPKRSLTVRVTGIKKVSGMIKIGLYNSEDTFMVSTFRACRAEVIAEELFIPVAADIPEGTYVVSLYHDENNNGTLDRNKLGIPKEYFGFSNNVKPKLKLPSFKSCQFEIKGNTTIHIQLQKAL